MPSASATIATAVNPGFFANDRHAKRTSASTGSTSWIACSASRRKLRLAADGAERPGRLFSDAGVGVLERVHQTLDGASIADGAERPRRLLPHARRGVTECGDETVDRAAVSDRAKRPRHLFADAGIGVLQGVDERRDRFR